MPQRRPAASAAHPQREQLHGELMGKVTRNFYEIFDDWYDRMGFTEGGSLLADCSRIMKELRTAPPTDDAMRYLLRYEKPLQLILSYWEGDMRSYCREDFTQAIDKLMESGMEDNFTLDPAYESAEERHNLDDMASEELHERLLEKLRSEHTAYMESWFVQDRQEMVKTLLNAADRIRILREVEREPPYDEQMRYLLQYKKPLSLILGYWVGYFGAYRPEDMDSVLNNLLENGAGSDFELDPAYRCEPEEPELTAPM